MLHVSNLPGFFFKLACLISLSMSRPNINRSLHQHDTCTLFSIYIFCFNISQFIILYDILHRVSQIYDKSVISDTFYKISIQVLMKSYYDSQVPEAIFNNRYFPSKQRYGRIMGKGAITLQDSYVLIKLLHKRKVYDNSF